jgi:hypothetical protein
MDAMNCRRRGHIAPRLRKKAVSVEGRTENHDHFAFGARPCQNFLKAAPYLWSCQTSPVPSVSTDAPIDTSFTTRSVPGTTPESDLYGLPRAELHKCANLFCGLAAYLVERRSRNKCRLSRCLSMDHHNGLAPVALSGQYEVTRLTPSVVANNKRGVR